MILLLTGLMALLMLAAVSMEHAAFKLSQLWIEPDDSSEQEAHQG